MLTCSLLITVTHFYTQDAVYKGDGGGRDYQLEIGDGVGPHDGACAMASFLRLVARPVVVGSGEGVLVYHCVLSSPLSSLTAGVLPGLQ